MKIFAVLGALAAIVAFSSPAQAMSTKAAAAPVGKVCWTHQVIGNKVCAAVGFDVESNGNLDNFSITLTCKTVGDEFDTPLAVDGHYLTLANDNGVTRWSLGETSDVLNPPCGVTYYPNITMTSSYSASLVYDFNAKFLTAPDPKDHVITGTFVSTSKRG